MIKVNSRYQKVSPKKAILVARLISGMKLMDARDQLINLDKKSAKGYLDLVKQIEAIAKTKGIDSEKLIITHSICQQAPMTKRRIFAGRGHANRILKRMSHFSITADIKEEEAPKDETKFKKNSTRKTAPAKDKAGVPADSSDKIVEEKDTKVKEDQHGTKS